jgi:hypothetical protein
MNHTSTGLIFLSEGIIEINATNCIIIKIPKVPVELVTGKIATLTTLKTRGKLLEAS